MYPFQPTYTLHALQLLNTPAYPSGVYRLAGRAQPTPIIATITDFGWVGEYINGRRINSKQSFLDVVGEAFTFPAYYGRNWDAFEEMINDLSWIEARGVGLLYDYVYRFAEEQPKEWQVALSILQGACARWQSEGVPFYVLLRQNGRWNHHLPKLAATDAMLR